MLVGNVICCYWISLPWPLSSILRRSQGYRAFWKGSLGSSSTGLWKFVFSKYLLKGNVFPEPSLSLSLTIRLPVLQWISLLHFSGQRMVLGKGTGDGNLHFLVGIANDSCFQSLTTMEDKLKFAVSWVMEAVFSLLVSTFCVPGTVSSSLHALCHLILTT